jgi:tetratricopeptide (TPR) repeat protein
MAAVVASALLSACTARTVPAPVVTTPRYPDFLMPPVPQTLAGTAAAAAHDRAWRFLQVGDLRSAEREAGVALQASVAFYPAEAVSGYIALARKDMKNALSHFDKALERQSTYVSALVGRGRALQALERDDEAIAAYQAALAQDAGLTDLSRQIDLLRFRGAERQIAQARQAARGNQIDEARALYAQAIVTSPDSAFLYRELAVLERQAGEADGALEHFRKAVELDPSDAAAVGQIAELLEAQGDLEAALKAYGNAFTLEPSDRLRQRRDALSARMELARLPEEYRAIESTSAITRAQLAALIGVRLARQLEAFPTTEPGVITDIRGDWAERWIVNVARAGVMEPYANHTFQPRAVVQRGELAPIAGRLIVRLSPPQQAQTWQATRTTFSDLSPSHLAYPAASTAVASGAMTSTPDGAFRPAQPVTGAEAIAMVDRVLRLAGPAGPAARSPRSR